MRHLVLLVTAICISSAITPGVAGAQWVRNGNPVCTANSNQHIEDIISDGAGGIIVVWSDERGGEYSQDIYIQRIDTLGQLSWSASGVPVCRAEKGQRDSRLVSDQAGGAIVVWEDHRGITEVYAQRVAADGTVLWTLDGVSVTGGENRGMEPSVVSDGSGGAIIAYYWYDKVYAQRIDQNGTVLWTPGGVLMSVNSLDKEHVDIATDGSGGAFVIWFEYFWHPDFWFRESHIQHVLASGARAFGDFGEQVCSDTYDLNVSHAIAGDGAGAAYITFTDEFGGRRLFVNRFDAASSSGVRPLSTVEAAAHSICFDGVEYAIAAWSEEPSEDRIIRAMRVGYNGSRQWSNESEICNADTYGDISTTTWSEGGILVAWEDRRAGQDIYVQSVTLDGNMEWEQDGMAVCTEDSDQSDPLVLSTAEGRAFVVWRDERGGDEDIYAMLVHPDLHFPELFSVADTSVDLGDTLVIQLFATDPDPGDTITYSTAAADVLPSSFDFDADAGLFSWIPHSGEAGDYQLIFGADDGLYKVQDTVLVSVFEDGNRPPVISAIEDQYIYGGDTLAFSVSFSDPDGDEVSLSIDEPRITVHDSMLIWLTMAGDTGTWHRTVTATDGTLEAEQEVIIKVLPYYPEGPQHDMMMANIHPHFEWVESNNIVWSTADGGYMTSGGNYFRIAVVSGRAFRLDEPLEAIFRIRSYADARSYIGFTTVSPETSDFDLKKVEWGIRCDESGYIRPVWAETNDYWEQIRLPLRMFFDCRMLLDATEGSITFTFEQVESAEAPLSDFVDPFFEVVESQILPDSCYIQLNTYNDRGRYYDLWLLQDGSETATMLVSSEASSYAEGLHIRWQVSEFTPREHFLIERSSGPDADFLSVEEGAITGDGIRFEYADRNAEPGVSYRYRVYLIGEEGGTVLFEAGPIKLPPVTLALYQNFPNPFNPSTTIGYYLPEKCHVILGIFDVSGKRLATLTDDFQDMGQYAIEWNGQDLNSNPVSSGIYFYRLKAGKETISKKMVLLR